MIAFKKANGLRGTLSLAVVAVAAGQARGAFFTPGDLVVSTYGSPTTNISQGGVAQIFLNEYLTSGGAAVVSDGLPLNDGVGGGGNLGIVGQYGSSSEGNLQLSGNGLDLTLGAYSSSAAVKGIDASTNTANGTSFFAGTPFRNSTVSLAQSTDTNVPRLAVLVDGNGNVNSSTELNDVYNTNNPRSVYSTDGSTFYISGQGDGNTTDQGIFYGSTGLNTVATPGAAPTAIYNAHETRFVTGSNNNLYDSIDTSSGKFTGIWQFSGLPTRAATATQIIPGNNGLSGSSEVFYSPDGFYFANPDTLYVADTGASKAGTLGDGGIQKWTFNGASWRLDYTLTPTTGDWIPAGNPGHASSGENGFSAITGEVVGMGANAQVELFAVSGTLAADESNGLYAITDTLGATSGSGESFTELESAAGNGGQIFMGVSFAPVPEPASLTLLGVGGAILLGRRKARRAR